MNSLEQTKQEARAQNVTCDDLNLIVDLTDGRQMSVPLMFYPRLWYASSEERQNCEIFGDGCYLHWPDVDEDLTVQGIVEGRRSAESPESIKKWLQARREQGKEPVEK